MKRALGASRRLHGPVGHLVGPDPRRVVALPARGTFSSRIRRVTRSRFLFLLAGYELEPSLLRERAGRLAMASWVISAVMSIAIGQRSGPRTAALAESDQSAETAPPTLAGNGPADRGIWPRSDGAPVSLSTKIPAALVTWRNKVSRHSAEVAAAFARAVRIGVLDDAGGRRAQRRFSREWPDLMRIPVTEALVARAEAVAWAHGLRGYDAIQLACALTWQDALGQAIVLATFARQLWEAAPRAGLRAWPDSLPE